VARHLGVEVETLGAWRRRGYGPRWYRIGKKIRYAESDLSAWMDAQALSGVIGQREGGPAAIRLGPRYKPGEHPDERQER
jgi:hypothetical protein